MTLTGEVWRGRARQGPVIMHRECHMLSGSRAPCPFVAQIMKGGVMGQEKWEEEVGTVQGLLDALVVLQGEERVHVCLDVVELGEEASVSIDN